LLFVQTLRYAAEIFHKARAILHAPENREQFPPTILLVIAPPHDSLPSLEREHTSIGASAAGGVNYVFGTRSESALRWLSRQGFKFKLDAGDASKARFTHTERGLTIETLAPAEPILAHANIEIRQPARLTVTWGVSVYPDGANWDVGVNNEAIMVMVQFGRERFSGGLFLPPSPYFIGFFLCEKGRRGIPITGRSYARQGRYVCVGGPAPGREITSEINLDEQFRRAFGRPPPPVTGFAIEADTTQVRSSGRASAWIKSLTIEPMMR
jgi:hypothetical protein